MKLVVVVENDYLKNVMMPYFRLLIVVEVAHHSIAIVRYFEVRCATYHVPVLECHAANFETGGGYRVGCTAKKHWTDFLILVFGHCHLYNTLFLNIRFPWLKRIRSCLFNNTELSTKTDKIRLFYCLSEITSFS